MKSVGRHFDLEGLEQRVLLSAPVASPQVTDQPADMLSYGLDSIETSPAHFSLEENNSDYSPATAVDHIFDGLASEEIGSDAESGTDGEKEGGGALKGFAAD